MLPPRLATPMTRILLLTALLACTASAAEPALSTLAERSGFQKTGRYDEVIALCGGFARAYPDAVRCTQFGTTPEGRPMQALVVSRSGALTPDAAQAKGLPVLLVQGGIHAGEIDGKDAGFLAVRDLLEQEADPGVLEHLVLVFVPVFNVDGHERFQAWNRPNQRGPEAMGWRTTAQNFNLNRDYLKADSAEMQAMLGLVAAWDPILTADLHVTDGAKFEHDVSIQVEPGHAGDAPLRAAGRALRDNVIATLATQGSLPVPFYPSFDVADQPSSGFTDGVSTPRFSIGYFQLRNRFGMLVETHAWKDYPHRVRVTRNTVAALVALAAREGRHWRALARAADTRTAQLAGTPVALDYRASGKTRLIDFRGYAYTRTPSEISGALMTRYDEHTPQVWRVPLRDDVQPSLTVTAPRAGYLVPAAHAAWVGAKLRLHGIAFRTLEHAFPKVAVEAFRADQANFAAGSTESHQRLALEGTWTPETRAIEAGALFVPIDQPRARLLMALLEPQAPDALAAWGSFNNAFEQKEYMEAYVAEEVARDMLAADPALQAEFTRRLREDPAFAKDPEARLEFFARRHPSWDERYRLYPVLRVEQAPGAATAPR
jgi:hypothetical protein